VSAGGESRFTSAPADGEGGDGGFEIRRYLGIVRRRWYVVVASAALGLGLVLAWLANTTPLYTASAQILIEPRKERVLRTEAVVGDLALDASSVATEISLIQSFAVAKRVVARLGLDQPRVGGSTNVANPTSSSVARFIPSFVSDSVAQPEEQKGPPPAPPPSIDGELSEATISAIAQVRLGVLVRRIAASYFLEVSYSHPDPALAAKFANAIAEAYLAEQVEAKYTIARRAAAWLREQIASVRAEVAASERAVAEHRAKYNLSIPRLGSGASTVAAQQAVDINAQLVTARGQTIEKKTKYDQARRLLDGGTSVENVSAFIESPIIVLLRSQDAELARAEADQLNRLGPGHPSIVKTRVERADIRQQINREVARIVASLKTDYEYALGKEEILVASLRDLTSDENRNDQAVIRLRELEREAQSNSAVYDALLARLKDIEQQASLLTADSRIIAPALVPGAPSYPDKNKALILGGFGGLLLGFVAAFLLSHENSFTTVEQTEKALHLPVLATVPEVSLADRNVNGRTVTLQHLLTEKPLSRFSESIRSARVGIETTANSSKQPVLVLVTSAVPEEGKTTLALSLACSAAACGRNTLLVEADLRRPAISKQFKLSRSEGLTGVLLGRARLEQVLADGPIARLKILPSGSTSQSPTDLFGQERLPELLQTLRESFDVVYIDAPPLGPVVDSAVLSRSVDAVVLVVKWRATPRPLVQRSVQLIDNCDAKISGVILNKVKHKQVQGYGSYYHYLYEKSDKYYS
jgi:capsular exopolysaccharide synthesis family protein